MKDDVNITISLDAPPEVEIPEFEPPAGYTAMVDNLASLEHAGVAPTEMAWTVIAGFAMQIDAPIRIYVYPEIVMLWHYGMYGWVGHSAARHGGQDD